VSMEAMYLRAWIDGLHRINAKRPQRPAEAPAPHIRLDGPGMPPTVPLRPLRGQRG
jgi:hypothetical protein